MLSEATTTEISKEKKPKTFKQNKTIAKQGGTIAGNTRKEIEDKTGKKIGKEKVQRQTLQEEKDVMDMVIGDIEKMDTSWNMENKVIEKARSIARSGEMYMTKTPLSSDNTSNMVTPTLLDNTG